MFDWLYKSTKKTSSESLAAKVPLVSGMRVAPSGIDFALQHHRAGRLPEAESAYHRVLTTDPENIDALHFLGVIAYQRGEYPQAAEFISRALRRNAANAAAHNNLGNVFRAQGNPEEAIASYRRALEIDPGYVDACTNLADAVKATGRVDEAIGWYRRAVLLAPGVPIIHFNLGNMLAEEGQADEAVSCYRKALEFAPDYIDACFKLGVTLAAQGKLEESIACFRKLLALKPGLPAAHNNLGSALKDQGKLDEAVAYYRSALVLQPDFEEARFNLGNALKDLGKLDEAIACYQEALVLRPDFLEACLHLGHAFRDQGKLDEAIACYQKVLVLKPELEEAHLNLGNVFKGQDRQDEAIACYRRALSLNSENAEARWALTMSQIPVMYEADADLEGFRAAFSEKLGELDHWFDSTRIASSFNAVGTQQPFWLAYQEENNRGLLQCYGKLCARIMNGWFERQAYSTVGKRDFDGTIRVGVVSAHFRDHSVWSAMVKGWFQELDRGRFALDAFYLGSVRDQETLFAESRASHFEQGVKAVPQWVETIIDRRPDVLIYPEIGMDPKTVKLASMRLAPVQIAAWGHPETTGLPTIDYYLSAEDLEPANAQTSYTEQLVVLPHLGCFYQPTEVDAVDPDLGSLNIDEGVPLLICPGVPFKYAPQYDRVFAEIARRLGRCQFIFFAHPSGGLSEKLRRRLEVVFVRNRLDIDDFVTFIPWQSRAGFYGLLKRADVFLDTIGFSGFNTAMQAAECGLPIVTREGRFMRGRLASGILKRMGLQELVADSEANYIALAVKLCQDSEYRGRIRERIEAGRRFLFEDAAPVRALEDFLAGVTRQR